MISYLARICHSCVPCTSSLGPEEEREIEDDPVLDSAMQRFDSWIREYPGNAQETQAEKLLRWVCTGLAHQNSKKTDPIPFTHLTAE